MGLYIYVTNEDRITMRKVSDPRVNEEFQCALKYDASLMIKEYQVMVSKGWLRKPEIKTCYTIFHETPAFDGSAYQAREQHSATGDVDKVVAYLHGIINGVLHYQNSHQLSIKNNQS